VRARRAAGRKHAPSGAAGLTADLGELQEFEREIGSYQTGEVARCQQSNRHHHASGGSRTRGTTKRPTDAEVGLFTRHPTAKYGKTRTPPETPIPTEIPAKQTDSEAAAHD